MVIFLAGWFEWWAALPLIGCVAYALRALVLSPRGAVAASRFPLGREQLVVAVIAGAAWTLLGGADHIFFANADWHIRDAVLHDLVVSPWPVGYGSLDGKESLLRAPVAFYLPAALLGKCWGLAAAHGLMGAWTAAGATLFLLQVLSLVSANPRAMGIVVAVVILFSGLDIVGNLLNDGPRFRSDWNVTMHLEWWAGKFQYSSMTTQLFWVPNHAFGGWLTIGLLARNERRGPFDPMIPMIVVAVALWSPLTAVGLVPFVLLRAARWLRPRACAPAAAVGLVIAAYLVLDPGRIPKGLAVSGAGDTRIMDLLQQAQFFLLEAGFIGAAIYALRPAVEVAVAIAVLALLPLVYFGPANDLVMRASIPSLAVLAIGACVALARDRPPATPIGKYQVLAVLLLIGAVTPLEEMARAALLPAWPINTTATLIGAACGSYAPNYVARLGGEPIGRLLRSTHRLALGPQGPMACTNPAYELMWNWSSPPRKDLRPIKTARIVPDSA
ncbi:MAG: hypothetical protein NVSMB10_01110 [Steroidobacteraceae bacterium]